MRCLFAWFTVATVKPGGVWPDHMTMGRQSARPGLFAARRRAAWALLAVGGVGCVVQVLAPSSFVGSLVYLVVAAVGVTMSVLGAGLLRGPRRRVWTVIALGQALYLVGDVLWVLYDQVWHVAPYPSVADVFYLVRYPLVALGLVWLVRGRRRGRDRAALLDAAIITTGVTVVATAFVIAPAAVSGGETLLSQAVAAAYPVGDLLLFAVLVRLLTTGAARSLALWSLVAGLGVLQVADIQYVLSVVSGAWYPSWFDALWLVAYLLIGFGSLHPSVDALAEPVPDRPERITVPRLVALGLALLLGPVTYEVGYVSGLRADAHVLVLVGATVAVGFVLARMWDLLRAQQAQAVQLAALARRDGLTGVANRRTWDHELSRACAAAREHHYPLALAVIDLDYFKDFNDEHGHLAGDLVLKETAAAWEQWLKGNGFLARFGGEEFTVLLPKTDLAVAGRLLGEMRRLVALGQTCSAGVAMWNDGEPPAAALARADEALYFAKRSGRNQVAAHDGTKVRELAARPHPLVPEIRIVFQPIVALTTGITVAYEALSRFEGRDTKEVFDEALRRGIAADLEAAALRRALEAWDGRPELLSLNVSIPSLLDPEVRAVLPDDLTGIVLEITESQLGDEHPDLLPTLADLRARHAMIAIDDAGTGTSNFERVVRLQPEILKFDISLVRDIDSLPGKQAMMRSALVFTRETGAALCAEGVETAAELRTLREIGVDLAQGILLGRPAALPARSSTARRSSPSAQTPLDSPTSDGTAVGSSRWRD